MRKLQIILTIRYLVFH